MKSMYVGIKGIFEGIGYGDSKQIVIEGILFQAFPTLSKVCRYRTDFMGI